jgi:hypothetical protein
LDHDNQVIPTEKWDAATTYKKCTGYQPGIGSIDNMPVYIEGRGGNSQAKYAQEDTLRRAFTHLKNNQVTVGRFRADSASYQQEVVKVVAGNCNSFYIRAKRSAGMEQQIANLPEENWTSVRLGTQKMQVAALPDFQPFGGQTAYRLVVSRIPPRGPANRGVQRAGLHLAGHPDQRHRCRWGRYRRLLQQAREQ